VSVSLVPKLDKPIHQPVPVHTVPSKITKKIVLLVDSNVKLVSILKIIVSNVLLIETMPQPVAALSVGMKIKLVISLNVQNVLNNVKAV
jgi:hypothetical protein